MTQLDLYDNYDYHTLEEVNLAMESLKKDDPEMFINYTLSELIDDGVTAGLLSPELGKQYLAQFNPKL